MPDWKTQRNPLLPAIPTEQEKDDFSRLIKWRRSMLDVITLFAANVYDDIRNCMSITVSNSSTVNLTVTNQVLTASVNAAGIYLDALAAPIYSNGRLDANSSWHGLCPKMSGNGLEYLSGTGIWSVPSGNGTGSNHVPASVNDTASINMSIDSANQIISGVVIPSGIKLDDFGTPDDNTDLNASNTRHGLLPKLSGNVNEFLAGDGTWAEPGGGANSNHAPVTVNDTSTINLTITANQVLSGIVNPGNIALDDLGTPSISTDLDANTIRHGLLRKLSGNANQYLDGAGNWTIPPGNANSHAFGNWSANLNWYQDYTANEDGFVSAHNPDGYFVGVRTPTNSSNDTKVITKSVDANTKTELGVVCPVKKGDIWYALTNPTTNAVLKWMPVGS